MHNHQDKFLRLLTVADVGEVIALRWRRAGIANQLVEMPQTAGMCVVHLSWMRWPISRCSGLLVDPEHLTRQLQACQQKQLWLVLAALQICLSAPEQPFRAAVTVAACNSSLSCNSPLALLQADVRRAYTVP